MNASWILLLSTLLLCSGLFLFLSKKNIVSILIGIELIFNAALVNFVAFSQWSQKTEEAQLLVLFALAVAAGEAALVLAVWRKASKA